MAKKVYEVINMEKTTDPKPLNVDGRKYQYGPKGAMHITDPHIAKEIEARYPERALVIERELGAGPRRSSRGRSFLVRLPKNYKG